MTTLPLNVFDQMRTWHWDWIKENMKKNWHYWVEADENCLMTKTRQIKRILVLPGVLTETNYAKMANIKKGTPTGELRQWSDLISGLTLMGHNVSLMVFPERRTATELESLRAGHFDGCSDTYHLIFTDYLGLSRLSRMGKDIIDHHR